MSEYHTYEKRKITKAGQPCRKCNTPVVKKTPKKRKFKPDQQYFYLYYYLCPKCNTMYHVDDAKRYFNSEEPPEVQYAQKMYSDRNDLYEAYMDGYQDGYQYAMNKQLIKTT